MTSLDNPVNVEIPIPPNCPICGSRFISDNYNNYYNHCSSSDCDRCWYFIDVFEGNNKLQALYYEYDKITIRINHDCKWTISDNNSKEISSGPNALTEWDLNDVQSILSKLELYGIFR